MPQDNSNRRVCKLVILAFALCIIAFGIGIGSGFAIGKAVTTSETSPLVDLVEPPLAIKSCPPAQSTRIEASENSNSAIVHWIEPTAVHPADIASIKKTHTSGDRFRIGPTEVVYTFTDKEGKTGTCSFVVSVIDVTPPVIHDCPMDKEYVVTEKDEKIVSWIDPTATDNSGSEIHVSQSHQQAFLFPAGDTKVTYHFVDASGNNASCAFTITVTGIMSPEVTNCPLDITRNVPPEGPINATTVWWQEPSATNPSGGTPLLERSHAPGESFNIGETSVAYTFTGDRGLQSVCKFNIIVIAVDGSPPTISNCPQDLIREARADGNSVRVWWTEPTVLSPSGRTINLQKPDVTPGSTFSMGTTNINYVFTDSVGLRATCTFHVIVNDVTSPNVHGCPNNITTDVSNVTKSGDVVVSWIEPNATDNSGGRITIERSHQPGSTFYFGLTEVTYMFIDKSDQEAICRFFVTVPDMFPPTVHFCPGNVVFQMESRHNSEPVNWTEPLVEDNSGQITLYGLSHTSGSLFPVGNTTVKYVYKDKGGNIAKCTFTVTGELKTSKFTKHYVIIACVITAVVVSVVISVVISCIFCFKHQKSKPIVEDDSDASN